MADDNGSTDNVGNPDNTGGPTTFSMDDFRTNKWKESITDEGLRTHKSLESIKDMDSLAKSYINAQSMVGRDKISIPNEGDTEGWNQVYDKLGRPKSIDEYSFSVPDNAPEKWNSEGFKTYKKEFKQQAYDSGLTKKQAEAQWKYVQDKALEGATKKETNSNQSMIAQVEELKKEYGTTLDTATTKRDAVLNKFGGQEAVEFIRNDPALNTSPHLMKVFNEIAKNFSEDTIIDATYNPTGQMSPTEAKSKISAILNDKNSAYSNRRDPLHEQAVTEFRNLIKMSKGFDK